MKTYIIKGWDTDKKITVNDDIEVSVNSYERGECMLVKFTRPKVNYEHDLIAAFDRIQTVYEEGTDILEHIYEGSDKLACTSSPSNSKLKWVAIK